MAANKFATMLHKNCHKIVVILVYALLEWILILLLLLNSFFSYLIAKFAKFFGLKPSCTWCSRLDHVFNTKKIAKNPHFDHVCEAHGTEISKMSYCSTHNKLAESKNLCIHCSSSTPSAYGAMNDISSTLAFFTWISTENASEGGDEDRCSCCDQILTTKAYPQSLIFNPTWDVLLEYIHKNKVEFKPDLVKKGTEFQENDQRALFEKDDEQQCDGGKKSEIVEYSNVEVQEWNSSQTTTDDPFWNQGCNEDDESMYIADMLLQNAELMDSDRFICIELIDTDAVAATESTPLTNTSEDVEEGRDDDDEQGLLLVEANATVLEAINNSSSLTDEYQEPHIFSGVEYEEKDYNLAEINNCGEAVGETESLVEQLERVESMEAVQEKAVNALYAELEEERKAAAEAAMETMAMITKLQEEKAAIQMEAVQYQRMMEEQAEYDQEALQLLNDLLLKRDKENKHLHKELEIYRTKVFDYEATEKTSRQGSLIRTPSSDNGGSDHSDDTHSIEEHDDLDQEMEETGADISLTEFDEERLSILQQLKVLEGKLLEVHEHEHDDEAKKLLPLFDELAENESAENESAEKEERSKMLLQEELGHVYERLEALEADTDFLNHCIRSIIKGNQGMALVQEILLHLRDLKSLQYSATNMPHIPLSDASMAKQDHQQ